MSTVDLGGKGPPPLDPKDLAGAHVLGQHVEIALPRDLVDEKPFDVGRATHFHLNPGKQWGQPFKNMSGTRGTVLGVTVLVETPDQEGWEPVVGARVVFRVQLDGTIVIDACTRGDGSTVALPAGIPGMCPGLVPILKETIARVEVWPVPKLGGRSARCVIHGIIQERVR